jgi:predicted HicB family RNase H-like nuclease
MPSARPEPAPDAPDARAESPHWPKIVVRVPPEWKAWLEEAASARALSVAALVRQLIRELMLERHRS